MNILYYGFRGAASSPIIGWTLIGLGIALFVGGCITFFYDIAEVKELSISFIAAIIAIVIGVIAKSDTRVPIVKATINNEIPWVEVAKDYKYLGHEGEIYIFEKLNTTIEEWEKKINEAH